MSKEISIKILPFVLSYRRSGDVWVERAKRWFCEVRMRGGTVAVQHGCVAGGYGVCTPPDNYITLLVQYVSRCGVG